jgi:DNA-binding protein HU-beta
VQITGFGTFQTRKRKKRKGRNPQTGETITIPASRFPAFSAGKSLKGRVAK